MSRTLKISLGIAAAVTGVLLLALLLAIWWFNPNRYRTELEQWASAQLGRTVSLQGDLNWHIGTELVLDIPRVQLANPAAFAEAGPFLSLSKATVRIALRPLLHQQLQFGALHAQGLQLNLQRNAAGQDNWTDLVALFSADGASTYQWVSVAGLTLQQCELNYADARTGQILQLLELDSRLGPWVFGQATDLAVTTRVRIKADAQHAAWLATLKLKTRVKPGADTTPLTLNDLQMTLTDLQTSAPAPTPALPTTLLAIRELVWDPSADALQVQGLHLQADTASLDADLQVQALSSEPVLTGASRIEVLQLRSVAQQWRVPLPETRDQQALQSLSAQLQARISAHAGQLTVAQLKLDETRVDGEVAWTGAMNAGLTLQLHADHINFDRYLPAANAGAAAPPQPVPLQWLQQLNARGTLSIDTAQWQGMRVRRFTLQLESQ